jgi:hypothetical protein
MANNTKTTNTAIAPKKRILPDSLPFSKGWSFNRHFTGEARICFSRVATSSTP